MSKATKDILWRLNDIRDMLMSRGVGGSRLYGCDEWSTPVVNLNRAIDCVEGLGEGKLNPMHTAPKDGTEILAYHIEGKCFHPIVWKDYTWVEGYIPHWGVRWNEEYRCADQSYSGWVEYPIYVNGGVSYSSGGGNSLSFSTS